MENNTIWKFLTGITTLALGWLATAFQKNATKHDSHSARLCAHDSEIAVFREQNKHQLEKMDMVIETMEELRKSNHTVLRALARKAKGEK